MSDYNKLPSDNSSLPTGMGTFKVIPPEVQAAETAYWTNRQEQLNRYSAGVPSDASFAFGSTRALISSLTDAERYQLSRKVDQRVTELSCKGSTAQGGQGGQSSISAGVVPKEESAKGNPSSKNISGHVGNRGTSSAARTSK